MNNYNKLLNNLETLKLLKIRDNLNSSLKKLNGSGNIINQIEKLEKLGCNYTKELPELPEDISLDS